MHSRRSLECQAIWCREREVLADQNIFGNSQRNPDTPGTWLYAEREFRERVAIGLASFAGYGLFEAVAKAAELGFQSVAFLPGPQARHSLGEFPTLNFYEADEAQRQRIKEAVSGFKHISIHQAWDNEWRKWIDCAHYLGAEIVTVHAGVRTQEETVGQFLERRAPLLRQIGEYAQARGIAIGVENEGGKYDDYVRLIKAIEHPAIGATIDVGHCAYFEGVKSIADMDERVNRLNYVIRQLVRDLGPKVRLFHVHNVQRYEDVDFARIPHPYWKPGSFVDHRCVAEGEIDFPQLFAVLKEVGYGGMFEIELEEPDRERKAEESGRYLTTLIQQFLS